MERAGVTQDRAETEQEEDEKEEGESIEGNPPETGNSLK